MPKAKYVNVPCDLLTDRENVMLFRSIGHSCVALSSGIVELHRTYEPYHDTWFREFTGIVCFIFDKNLKNFFIRMYSLIGYDRIWEFRVPYWLGYVESAPYFHQFEGKDCVFGLNFCSEVEARSFSKTVNDTLDKFEKIKAKGSKRSKGKRRKKSVSKPVISGPTDFRHVEHYGLEQFQGLLENLDCLQSTFPRQPKRSIASKNIQPEPEVNIQINSNQDEPRWKDDYEELHREEEPEMHAQNSLLDEIRNATLKHTIPSDGTNTDDNNPSDCTDKDYMRNALDKIMLANFGSDYDDNDDYSIAESDWDP